MISNFEKKMTKKNEKNLEKMQTPPPSSLGPDTPRTTRKRGFTQLKRAAVSSQSSNFLLAGIFFFSFFFLMNNYKISDEINKILIFKIKQ